MPAQRVSQRVSAVVDVARDLRRLATQPTVVLDRARLIRRKLPSIVSGLKVIGKSDKTEALSIGSMLERNAAERPNDPALLFEDERYTHRDLHEISNRYDRDPEFRNTVDRYVSDFERLLAEAEQSDPAGNMLQNYLVSETGRVYLLLAHASGRLR